MGHVNGYITAPINTDDVSATLGASSHDVGYLCSNEHGQTNKWAKYKPVRIDTPADITDAQRKAVNHGLVVTNALKTDGSFNVAEWSYDAPNGTWWKRLTDFDGYSHGSNPPIYIMSDETDIDGCTVVTWDEGTTKIDDFKILAGYQTSGSIVGPPSQFGIKMDELNFGSIGSEGIGEHTWGLVWKDSYGNSGYLGASKKFNYGSGEAPCCDFSTKMGAIYNHLTTQLTKTSVGGYIEVLPVIDTMDFSANKTGIPQSGLTGFPIGKKLRIYHQKSVDWYLTAVNGNMSLAYITSKDTGTTKSCGTIYHSSITSGGITRELPSDPANQYYIISAQYNFYNNRNYAITLNNGAFYLVIANSIKIECLDLKVADSTSNPGLTATIAANSTKAVVMRFRLTVEEFNKRFAPVTGLSTQPVQNAMFRLAFRNPNNLVTVMNSSGVEQAENWQFYFQVLK